MILKMKIYFIKLNNVLLLKTYETFHFPNLYLNTEN